MQQNSEKGLCNEWQYCKVMGYVHYEQQGNNYFPIQDKLPVPINILLRMMIHLIEIVTEIESRGLPLPYITLTNIKLHKQTYHLGLVYLFAPKYQMNSGNAFQQIKEIFKNLSFDREIYEKSKNLADVSDLLWKELVNLEVKEMNRKFIFNLCNFAPYVAKILGIKNIQEVYNYDKYIYLYASQNHSLIEVPENQKIAIKFSIENEEIYKGREIQILEKLNTPHTSKLYCYLKTRNITILILKYHDKTFKDIQLKFKETEELGSKLLIYYFKAIMISLQQLHGLGIIHRDLKPDNIMFDYPNEILTINDYLKAICIIIDFDRSKAEDDKMKSQYQGTPNYVPPEGVLERYTPSYDVYQVGMIFLLSKYNEKQYKKCFADHGIRPLPQDSYNQLIHKICSCSEEIKTSSELMNLIKSMINYNPEQRPSVAKVIHILTQLE